MSLTSPTTISEKINRTIIRLTQKAKYYKIVNLASAPWLVKELKSQGINAKYFPLSTLEPIRLKLQNSEISVRKDIDFLSYVPISSFKFYGGHYILNLARQLPSYKFMIIAPDVNDSSKLPSSSLKNLIFKSRVPFEEMKYIYARTKCFLRLTKHDGLSLSVLESLFYKLQVIWTYSFPYTIYVKYGNIEELKQVLLEVINSYRPNEEGHNYVLNVFHQTNLKKRYELLFNALSDYLKRS
ncbi:MAG: hypothetical protein ACTSVW_06875 [Candidatus Njordarchaeales archaeon]